MWVREKGENIYILNYVCVRIIDDEGNRHEMDEVLNVCRSVLRLQVHVVYYIGLIHH